MTLRVRDVMTGIPVVLQQEQTVVDAACAMRDHAVGCVLVARRGQLRGLLTDRDIVVRAIAEEADPVAVSLGEICSMDVAVVAPDDDLDEAINIMRRRAVRRLPVVQGLRPIGVVSLGDLALERERPSTAVLADISAAPPNA